MRWRWGQKKATLVDWINSLCLRSTWGSSLAEADTTTKRTDHLSYVEEVTAAIHQAEGPGVVGGLKDGWWMDYVISFCLFESNVFFFLSQNNVLVD